MLMSNCKTCCAVLCCAVLCCAVLGWAGLGCAGLGWAVLYNFFRTADTLEDRRETFSALAAVGPGCRLALEVLEFCRMMPEMCT